MVANIGFPARWLYRSIFNTHLQDRLPWLEIANTSRTKNSQANFSYNFAGFKDDDFDDAEYKSKGVYLKFRFKFDQDSAKQLFRQDNVFAESK